MNTDTHVPLSKWRTSEKTKKKNEIASTREINLISSLDSTNTSTELNFNKDNFIVLSNPLNVHLIISETNAIDKAQGSKTLHREKGPINLPCHYDSTSTISTSNDAGSELDTFNDFQSFMCAVCFVILSVWILGFIIYVTLM